MVLIGFEINGNYASALHYGANSFPPFFGNASNTKNCFQVRKLHFCNFRKLNFGPILVSMNGSGSNDGVSYKELEFKPSFDDYLKAMESRSVRVKKKHIVKKGDEGNSTRSLKKVGEKNNGKGRFEDGKVDEAFVYKEGSSLSNGKVRGKQNKGFKNEYGGNERNLFEDAKVDEAFVYKEGSSTSNGKVRGKQGFKNEYGGKERNLFEDTKVDEAFVYKEGSSMSNGKFRGKLNKGFENEYGGKERNPDDAKEKQKHGANMSQDRSWKPRSRSLEPKSDDCRVIKSQGKSGNGRISNGIVRPNSNDSRGSMIERLVTRDIYSSKTPEEKVVSIRQRDYNRQGKSPDGNNIVVSKTVTDRGMGRRDIENESLANRKGWVNVKSNGSRKRFLDRGYDSDNLEVEREAFKNLEDPNNVISKTHFSHKEMEERIQKLAKLLNGADINLPEWMFSQMIRSAKLKFNDYSIRRLITILGNLGNWQRVVQVIEWLQRSERFKSHNPRRIYTAALDALGKLKRPVESVNVFNAMQQQMSSYPDMVAYHSIAVTLGQAGHMKQLFDVIDIMRSPPKKNFKKGLFENWDPRLEPDIVVYNAVLNACVKLKQWEGAFWVLQQLKKQNIRPSAATYGLVMEVMFSCGKYNLVHEFFRKLQKSSIPNSLTYRVLVNTFCKEGKTDEAVSAVHEMERRGIVGSASLYYDLARGLCAAGRRDEALMQIDKICKVANKPLVVTYTGLMQASLDSGNIQDGAYIFEKMKETCAPNLVTYNIMLKAYLEHGMFREAKELFEQMLGNTNHLSGKADYKMRVIPDIYTFNTMLDACVAANRWDYFDHVYERMLYHGYHFNPKRHLGMILEASKAGKEVSLEITWKHLTTTDRIPPASLIKERFCTKLEKGDYVAALTCITNNLPKDLHPFSKSSWLNLLKENSQRFKKDTLVRLMNAARNAVSNSSVPNPILVCLMQSCKEFCSATELSAADIGSMNNAFAEDSRQEVATSR